MVKMEKIKKLVFKKVTEADFYKLALEYKNKEEDKEKIITQIKTGKKFEINIPIWSVKF